MREIKFRAWNGIKMLDNPKFEFFNHGRDGRAVMMADEDDTVEIMQYTGLLDKNGKEIYEGDIVSTYIKNEYGSIENIAGEVVYIDGIAMFNLMVNWYDGRLGFEFYRIENTEIIGNIYENPDLLN